MLAAKVISQAMRQYQDLGGDRTTVSAWVDFLNLAQHQVVLHKPDASSVVENMQLAPGVLQSIPTGRMRLLRVFRNMGTDGATPGKVVGLCDQEALGLANLLWPSAEASVAVDNYAFDDLFPEKFWVSPPVHATTAVYVEIGCSSPPAEIEAASKWDETEAYALDDRVFYWPDQPVGAGAFYKSLQSGNTGYAPDSEPTWWDPVLDVISLADVFVNPMLKWMLYLAFDADPASDANQAGARAAELAFYQSLGIKAQRDMIISPNAGAR